MKEVQQHCACGELATWVTSPWVNWQRKTEPLFVCERHRGMTRDFSKDDFVPYLADFDPRAVCFSLARICLILGVTILATELLFPPFDRHHSLMGGMATLICCSVFSMWMTWPRKKDRCPPNNDP